MATKQRFVAKYGLDNQSNTIQNVADPVNPQDAATRNFSINASNLASGTLSAARLPAFTGDATSTAGTSALTLANTTVTPGSYTNASITVDAKGRITSATSGSASGTGVTAGSTSTGYVIYNGTTQAAGQWDGGTTLPASSANRLNFNGKLYTTEFVVTNGTTGTISLLGTGATTVHSRNLADSDYTSLYLNGNVVSLGTRRSANSVTELLRLESDVATVIGGLKLQSFTLTTTTTTANQVADAIPVANVRSAKYTVQVMSGGAYQVVELLAIHDGTTAYLTEYGSVSTSGSPLATFDVDVAVYSVTGINSLRLLVTPVNASTGFIVARQFHQQ